MNTTVTLPKAEDLTPSERNELRETLLQGLADINSHESSLLAAQVTLQQVVENVDHYEAILSAPDSITENPDAHSDVSRVFSTNSADLHAVREVCARLMPYLAQAYRINLIRSNQKFWLDVIKDSRHL